MTDNLFAPDYKNQPYWWEAAPQPALPPIAPPATCDVAIVGSGYTGLSAALELARGGRQVVVVDAQNTNILYQVANTVQARSIAQPRGDADLHGCVERLIYLGSKNLRLEHAPLHGYRMMPLRKK